MFFSSSMSTSLSVSEEEFVSATVPSNSVDSGSITSAFTRTSVGGAGASGRSSVGSLLITDSEELAGTGSALAMVLPVESDWNQRCLDITTYNRTGTGNGEETKNSEAAELHCDCVMMSWCGRESWLM